MAAPNLISIAAAARMLGYKSKKTILRLGEQGLLHPRKVRERWVVSRAEVRSAPVLTTGRAAKLAGCSKKTVYRRIAAGVVVPVRPAKPADWISRRAVPRLSLADVAVLRASMERRRARRTKRKSVPSKSRRPAASLPAQPRLGEDRNGRLWIHAFGRWWPIAGAPRSPRKRAQSTE